MALTPEIKAVVSVIFPRLCPSLPTTNQASESSARRTVQPSSCAVFICSRLSITRCFTGLGRSSICFLTVSGRWRSMSSGLSAVASSSSAACGVPVCRQAAGNAAKFTRAIRTQLNLMGEPGFNNRHRRLSGGSVLLMPDGTSEELSFCRKKRGRKTNHKGHEGTQRELAANPRLAPRGYAGTGGTGEREWERTPTKSTAEARRHGEK